MARTSNYTHGPGAGGIRRERRGCRATRRKASGWAGTCAFCWRETKKMSLGGDCGFPGVDESTCTARGCVWVHGFPGPWCQFPAWDDGGRGELESTANAVDVGDHARESLMAEGWAGTMSHFVWDTHDDPFPIMLVGIFLCLLTLCAAAAVGHTRRSADAVVLAVIAALSFASRFYQLDTPGRVVLDEVHFGKFVNRYWSGRYYFDIHPPVGKLILAALGWLGGHDPGFDFSNNGKAFDSESQFVVLRRASALFGAALPILAYLQLRVWRLCPHAAAFGAGLLLFEVMHVTQARHILLDSQLVAYQAAALLFASLLWTSKLESCARRLFFAAATGIFSALGALVKVTGLAMVGLIILESAFALTLAAEQGPLEIAEVVPMAVAFSLTEVAAFAAHFALLPRTGNAEGYNYDDYHSSAFRASLKGEDLPGGGGWGEDESTEPLGLFGKMMELNYRMTERSAAIDVRHPAESRWTTWPADAVGFLYYRRRVSLGEKAYDAGTPRVRIIYLIGNPGVIYPSTLVVVIWALHLALQVRHGETFRRGLGVMHKLLSDAPSDADLRGATTMRPSSRYAPASRNDLNAQNGTESGTGEVKFAPAPANRCRHSALACLLFVGWAANMLPFMFVKRSTWLYHYMGAEYLACLLAAVTFERFMPCTRGLRSASLFVSLAPAAAFAAFLAPWSYAIPLRENQHAARRLLPSWHI